MVIGAGHAGCEAGLAAARAGVSVLVITPNADRTGYMPCNPSIGGPGKSHIVAEVDALGGEMARAADTTSLHIRTLNTSKGPAVRAIRSQQDKSLYAIAMKAALETQPGLTLLQDEVVGLSITTKHGEPTAVGVTCRQRGTISCGSVVVTAGTFLRAALISGESRTPGGRAGDRQDDRLAGDLNALGFKLRRLKTGTPPRIDGRTIDFSLLDTQEPSNEPLWLSRDGQLGGIETMTLPALEVHVPACDSDWRAQLACFRTETNPATHDQIRENLDRAPMFNGSIDGVGPRYCPSVEDKVARFADKESHPVFLEPEGWQTAEYYVQGMSTSLPYDVQDAAIASIRGLANARITRYGYAVEYDAIDPAELTSTFESRRIRNLFLAGQVNGTSGYEEAAGQGLMAGLNAANAVAGRPLVVLPRDLAYIGVMVDDLVTRPFDEPYRMLTSRAEFRLTLRPETSDERLAAIAFSHGLISASRYAAVQSETEQLDRAEAALDAQSISSSPRFAGMLDQAGIDPVNRSVTLLQLLRRPDVDARQMQTLFVEFGMAELLGLDERLLSRLEERVKYGGFVEREAKAIARGTSNERRPIDRNTRYDDIVGLRNEARSKLALHRPATLGEASRLSGVTPADVAVLLVYLSRRERPIAEPTSA